MRYCLNYTTACREWINAIVKALINADFKFMGTKTTEVEAELSHQFQTSWIVNIKMKIWSWSNERVIF